MEVRISKTDSEEMQPRLQQSKFAKISVYSRNFASFRYYAIQMIINHPIATPTHQKPQKLPPFQRTIKCYSGVSSQGPRLQILLNIIGGMRSGSREEIGLFTFYKTQEEQEEKLRGIYRKQRKGKSVKSRKAFKEAVRERTKERSPIGEDDSDLWSESANEKIYEEFLKNIPHKQAKSPALLTQMEESLIHSVQLRTQPTLGDHFQPPKAKQSRNLKVQIVQQLNKYNFVQEIEKIPPAKPTQRIEELLHICQEKLCDNLSHSTAKIRREKAELTGERGFKRTPVKENKPQIRSPMMIKIERLMEERNLSKNVSFAAGGEDGQEERKSNEKKEKEREREREKGEVKEQRSFLQKLQLIESKAQQSNRQAISLRSSHTTQQLHENNKKYFHNLMTKDLHLQPEVGTQVAFRILRQTLKFPQIPLTTQTSTHKPLKIETNPSSPVKKKLIAPRSLSCHKKELKVRRVGGNQCQEGDNFYLLTEASEPLMTKSKSNHVSPAVLSHKNSKNYKKDDGTVVKLFKSRLQTHH